MNIKLLNQVLKFENNIPNHSDIKELNSSIVKYQDENGVNFFKAKSRQKPLILNENSFFEYVSDELLDGTVVNSFKQISNILNASTREENILVSGNSKTIYTKVFDEVIVVKKVGEIVQLLQKNDLHILDGIDSFVAIENGESFLNIDSSSNEFKFDNYIYISGFPNKLTKEFLKNKRVEFFLDFDIGSMNIYESIECVEKFYFLPDNLDDLFGKIKNTDLYKKQIKNLKPKYSEELTPLVNLIKKHNVVVEQEICR